MDKCPECGSVDVLMGYFPLQCLTCGWSHLNLSPCRICGGESVSCVGSNEETLYGCKEHPVTDQERKRLFQNFSRSIVAME